MKIPGSLRGGAMAKKLLQLLRPRWPRQPAVRHQELPYQRWLAACPGLIMQDAAGRLLVVNDRAALHVGLDAQTALGQTFSELALPGDFVAAWEQFRRERTQRAGEFRLGDRVLGCEVTWADDGTSMAVWRHLTPAAQSNLQLEGREVLLNCLLTNAPFGIAILDGNHRYGEVNPAFCSMLGYTADELKAMPYAAMHHPLDARTELEATTRLLNGEVPVMHLRRRYTTKDGRDIPTAVTGMVCTDSTGALIGMPRIIVDLTDKYQLVEHERVMAELRRSNRDLEHYASIASHDLQEPVRMVATHLTLVLERNSALDAKTRHHLAAAAEAAVRMRQLMRDLMEYARLVTSDRTQVTTSLTGLVQSARSALTEEITATGAIVAVGPMPTLMVDGEQITSVFTNLLSNALKFKAGEPPQVRIAAERCEEGWLFTVTDNGIGLPAEHCESVFGIFNRLHSREVYAGTGIGLALCRKIIEGHGGRIWLESVPGKGTTAKFILLTGENHRRLDG